MAGGKGARFWPLSRERKPKQFLPIVSEKTMLEETVNRILPLIPSSKIYTVANLKQTKTIRKLLPYLPSKNLLVEPKGKNTAPSLIFATATLYLQNQEAIVAALPADHIIQDSKAFLKKLEAAAEAAAKKEDLITFGIPPSFPATGYGYIQFSKKNSIKILGEDFYEVKKFKEKPDAEKAKYFLSQGNYYWNSGMFIWHASVFAQKLRLHAPLLYSYWERILDTLKRKNSQQIKSIFEEIPSISIDYGLMEKAKGVLMGKGEFGWSDVGSWSSLAELWTKDKEQNTARGEYIAIASKNCLIHSPRKLTALIGVQDLIVVDVEDALLICHKAQDQKIKELVETIRKKGKIKYL